MDLDLKIVSKDINEMLWKAGKTLACAESCTAGRISSVITAIPGSSNYFKGGLVCYADEVKSELLKVDPNIIAEKTAVCEEVVKQMVAGAADLFHCDYMVATTGFAGPAGTDTIKVGTIWVAVGTKDKVITCLLEEDNGRDKNVAAAVNKAMHMLRDLLKDEEAEEV